MMKKSHILIIPIISFFIFSGIYSCKKDQPIDPIIEDDPELIDDLRNVRILKVEQTVSPNQFPFTNNTLMTVEYIYNDEKLTQIKTLKSNGEALDFDVSYFSDDSVKISFPDQRSMWEPFFGTYWLKSVHFQNRKNLFDIVNHYETDFPGLFNREHKQRKVSFITNSENNIYSISGSFTGANAIPTWVGDGIKARDFKYSNGMLKGYHLFNKSGMFSIDSLGQNYQIEFEYSRAHDIPNGLIHLFNHAVTGVYQFGFEDLFFHWIYDISLDNSITLLNNIREKVIEPNYNFSDWIIGFGFPHIEAFNRTNNQIVQKKNVQGTKFYDLDTTSTPISIIYKDVNETTTYPYSIDTTNKILKIAGLNIYYEIID